MKWSGNPYRRGKISTVDLHLLTSLVQLIFKMKKLFTFLIKQATLLRRSTVLSRPLQLEFPGNGNREDRRDKEQNHKGLHS